MTGTEILSNLADTINRVTTIAIEALGDKWTLGKHNIISKHINAYLQSASSKDLENDALVFIIINSKYCRSELTKHGWMCPENEIDFIEMFHNYLPTQTDILLMVSNEIDEQYGAGS